MWLFSDFKSRKDDELPDACLHRPGWSVVFRKTPPMNSIGPFMSGDCWIGGDSIVHTRVLLWPFGFRGSALLVVTIMEHAYSFHGEVSRRTMSLKRGSVD
jgi:hypothetical protein